MKTAISIPDPVFKAGEALARQLGMSRSQLYTRAIEAFAEAHQRGEIRRKLDEVYGHEDSSLDPVLGRMQAAALPKERW